MGKTDEANPTTPDVIDPDDTVADGEIVPFQSVDVEQVGEYVNNLQQMVVDDPDAIALKIAQRRLAAETPEQLLAPMEVRGADEVQHRPMLLQEVHFNESRHEGGTGVYAILDVVLLDTGEPATVACGAADVLVQLYKLAKWKALPIKVKIVPARNASKAGRFPLHLEAVPDNDPQVM